MYVVCMYVDRRRESTLAAKAFGTLQSMLISLDSFHLISRGGSCSLVGWYINCSYSVLHQRFLNVYIVPMSPQHLVMVCILY